MPACLCCMCTCLHDGHACRTEGCQGCRIIKLLLCNVQEQAREEAFDDRVHAEMEFFRYVATAYRHFLAGNDAACAAVDEEQSAAFRERADAMRARNQELAQVPKIGHLHRRAETPCGLGIACMHLSKCWHGDAGLALARLLCKDCQRCTGKERTHSQGDA